MKRSKKTSTSDSSFNSRTNLQSRSLSRLSRNARVAATRGVTTRRRSLPPIQVSDSSNIDIDINNSNSNSNSNSNNNNNNNNNNNVDKNPTRADTCEIHRDSRKQLNISGSGVFYEKAKSRRTRTRSALNQSGNRELAIALGVGNNKSRTATASATAWTTNTFDIETLNNEFEKKSFIRRASIAHGLKRQKILHRQENDGKPIETSRRRRRQEQLQDQRKISNLPKPKSQPDSESRIIRTRSQAAIANTIKRKRRQEREEDYQPQRESQRESESNLQIQTQILHKSEQKQRDLNHRRRKPVEQQIIPDVAKRAVSKIATPSVVIELLSSDSDNDNDNDNDSDSDSHENDVLLALTQLLQDEAIGRGADRNEMRAYAQQLLRLGLHSREMILYALDLNSNDKDDGNNKNAALTNADMANDIVNRWEWMKPFHKTVFYRWLCIQQRRQREGSTQKTKVHHAQNSKKKTKKNTLRSRKDHTRMVDYTF